MPTSGFIEHVWESECPVSAITQKSIDLVQIVNGLRVAHESAGSAIAADTMPGAIFDAIKQCEFESIAAHQAERDSKER